jgi:hypothetical protein
LKKTKDNQDFSTQITQHSKQIFMKQLNQEFKSASLILKEYLTGVGAGNPKAVLVGK